MTRSNGSRRRQRGGIDTLPSGALRVRVYAGLDPLTRRRNYLIEVIPPGPTAAREAEQARTRLLLQVDEKRNPRTQGDSQPAARPVARRPRRGAVDPAGVRAQDGPAHPASARCLAGGSAGCRDAGAVLRATAEVSGPVRRATPRLAPNSSAARMRRSVWGRTFHAFAWQRVTNTALHSVSPPGSVRAQSFTCADCPPWWPSSGSERCPDLEYGQVWWRERSTSTRDDAKTLSDKLGDDHTMRGDHAA
jgi:hypothetical protein